MTLILSGTDGVSDIDGTAATPAIRGTDANTGIFFPAADTIAFAEGGAEAMRIDSSGNLGLGVTPSAWNTSVFKALQINAQGALMATSASMQMGNNVFYDGAYKFIGTGYANRYYQASGQHVWTVSTASGSAGGTITETQAMTLDASGNLGIGTSSPLSASNYVFVTVQGGSSGGGYIQYNSSGSRIGQFTQDSTTAYLGNFSNNPLVFQTNNTERARITSGGYFKASNSGAYLGSTSPYHEMRQSAAGDNILELSNTNTSTPFGMRVQFTGATPNNTTQYFLSCDDSTNIKAIIYSNGTYGSRTGTYGLVSDIKLKQDVVDANSQWDDIKALRIVKYRLKDEVAADPNYPAYIGVIAQEVEQVSPGLVEDCADFENVTKTREVEKTREVTPAVLDDEGNEVTPAVTETYTETEEYTERVATGTVTKSVKSSIIYMKAVKALQEAMTRIETLEAQNASFEARLAALEAK